MDGSKRLVHNSTRLESPTMLRQILNCYREHIAAWRALPRLQKKVPANCFIQGDFHRTTSDVVIWPKFSMSVAVLFHSNGDIFCVWTKLLSVMDPLIGEAETALLAFSKAQELKTSHLWLEGDFYSYRETSNSFRFACLYVLADWVVNPQFKIHAWSFSTSHRADNDVAHSLAAWRLPIPSLERFHLLFALKHGLWKFDGPKLNLHDFVSVVWFCAL